MKLQFRHKRGPVLTQGRLQHLLFGILIVFAPGALAYRLGWADKVMDVSQWGLVFIWFFALIWELSTPFLASRWFRHWAHPFGDVLDLAAYLIGGIVTAFWISLMGW